MPKEARARIKINLLLQQTGWRFFDDEKGTANIGLEVRTKISQKDIDALGEDFEKTKNGFIDFLLLDDRGFPLAVLEAKREEKDPLDGKEQARRYAQSQNVRFVILSNGNLHYFWDIEYGNPEVVTSYPTPESFAHLQTFKPNPRKLAEEGMESDYVVQTQMAGYELDPRWKDEAQRDAYFSQYNLTFLRPYQLRAIRALQDAARKGSTRYLFEMATGTGKTHTSAAVCKLFLKTGNAKRILFLVDRIELETQGHKALNGYLKNDYTCVVYKQNRDDWRKAEIVVSTVQSLVAGNKYRTLFAPTDFDLVISDEAHRSISGNSRAVFEYFIGYKLGLTATPKDYLKNLDARKVSEKDPRAWERRQLLDTYITFGCGSGDPTFRYSLLDGVKDGFLVNPVVTDARTEITTQLLSDEGYAVLEENEEGEEVEETYFQKDFERRFFSEKTNRIFCETFLRHALDDPISGEIGKSILFCVSQKHASHITQMLNLVAHELFPGKYNSDFAIQITSNIADAQQYAANFANNNLGGHTRFLDGYKSSKTRACVTVGMMTTGYDCRDIMNLCLMRPIFSPTDFIQIKGRGTRRFQFAYSDGHEEHRKEKTSFKLFDFFANCEYFEEKFKYDEVLKLPRPKSGKNGGEDPPPPPKEGYVSGIRDPLKSLKETAVGIQGMRVDREFFGTFVEKVKAVRNPDLQALYDEGKSEEVKRFIWTEVFDKPAEYFNLEKLRKALKLDRRVALGEIIDHVFGGAKIRSRDELLEQECDNFVSIYKPASDEVLAIKNFLKAYVADPEFRKIIDEKDYAALNAYAGFSVPELRSLGRFRDVIPEYVRDYIHLNSFA